MVRRDGGTTKSGLDLSGDTKGALPKKWQAAVQTPSELRHPSDGYSGSVNSSLSESP